MGSGQRGPISSGGQDYAGWDMPVLPGAAQSQEALGLQALSSFCVSHLQNTIQVFLAFRGL